jgi:hypothetical protein
MVTVHTEKVTEWHCRAGQGGLNCSYLHGRVVLQARRLPDRYRPDTRGRCVGPGHVLRMGPVSTFARCLSPQASAIQAWPRPTPLTGRPRWYGRAGGTLEDAAMRASSRHTTQPGSTRSRMGPACLTRLALQRPTGTPSADVPSDVAQSAIADASLPAASPAPSPGPGACAAHPAVGPPPAATRSWAASAAPVGNHPFINL